MDFACAVRDLLARSDPNVMVSSARTRVDHFDVCACGVVVEVLDSEAVRELVLLVIEALLDSDTDAEVEVARSEHE